MTYAITVLAKHHQRKGFDCGQAELNDFITLYALQQQKRGQNKTYVAHTETQQITGFYSLNVGAITFAELPLEMQKRLARYPVPVVCIGRFAVDNNSQAQGLGKYLLSHALRRVCDIATIAGVVLVMVEAKDEKAAKFYQSVDFRPLPDNPLKLFLPVSDLLQAS